MNIMIENEDDSGGRDREEDRDEIKYSDECSYKLEVHGEWYIGPIRERQINYTKRKTYSKCNINIGYYLLIFFSISPSFCISLDNSIITSPVNLSPAIKSPSSVPSTSLSPSTSPSSPLALTTLLLQQRNVIIVAGTESVNSSIPTTTISAHNITTSSTSTSNSNSTNSNPYSLDIPDSSGSSGLKYLYFFFLIIGIIIAGLIARVYIVKKRRAKNMEKSSAVRSEALRLDMQSHNQRAEMIQRERNDGIDDEDRESFQPPPPYPRRDSGNLPSYGTSPPSQSPTPAITTTGHPFTLPSYIEEQEEEDGDDGTHERDEYERYEGDHIDENNNDHHQENSDQHYPQLSEQSYDHNDDMTPRPNHESYYGVVNHYVSTDHSNNPVSTENSEETDGFKFVDENDETRRLNDQETSNLSYSYSNSPETEPVRKSEEK